MLMRNQDIKKAINFQAKAMSMSGAARQRILRLPQEAIHSKNAAPPSQQFGYIFQKRIVKQSAVLAASFVVGIFGLNLFLSNSSGEFASSSDRLTPSSAEFTISPSEFDDHSLDPSGIFTTHYPID